MKVANTYLDATPMRISLADIQQRDQAQYEELMGPFLRGERDSGDIESF
jgi:hypothetical protein